ncbi:MAG: hypothetical protein IBJ14_07520 [Hydrogenophaga sp.]|nr:hypothetical protein [Hydrogenophaga sp.]
MNFRTALIASAIATLGASAWAQGSTTPAPTTPSSTMTMPAQTQKDMGKDMKKDKMTQTHDKAAKDEKKVGHKKHQKKDEKKLSHKKDTDHKLQPATHKPDTMGTGAATTKTPAQ